jgi:hypothetical protein
MSGSNLFQSSPRKQGRKLNSTTPYRTVEEISPLPKSNGVRTRNTTATTVLTSTPHKLQMENKVSCRTKKRKLAFPESIAERRPSWFCKLCKLDEMRDMTQCMGCRGWVHQDCAKVVPRRRRIKRSTVVKNAFRRFEFTVNHELWTSL